LKKRMEIGASACAMILMLGGVGCSISAKPCDSNDKCVEESASCRADTGWCDFWESQVTASRNGDWKDATIGNPYEVRCQGQAISIPLEYRLK
jgi:hypothetical protein